MASAMACAPLVDYESLTDHHGEPGETDGSVHADGGGDAGSKDAAAASDTSPCQGQNNGFYCGNDGLDAYAGDPSDLVWCYDSAIQTVEKCSNGCIVSPYRFPDTCDRCSIKGDGTWCGKEFPNYRVELKEVASWTGGRTGMS